MLDDAARKVLTVLWNTHRNDPFRVDVDYISQRAQRTKGRTKVAINTLVKEGYILWNKQDNVFQVLYYREDTKPAPFRGWIYEKN